MILRSAYELDNNRGRALHKKVTSVAPHLTPKMVKRPDTSRYAGCSGIVLPSRAKTGNSDKKVKTVKNKLNNYGTRDPVAPSRRTSASCTLFIVS